MKLLKRLRRFMKGVSPQYRESVGPTGNRHKAVGPTPNKRKAVGPTANFTKRRIK